jgi:rare lipoprotein A
MNQRTDKTLIRGLARIVVIGLIASVAACSGLRPESVAPRPTGEQPTFTQDGTASWYGQFHNGRKTANGEIYDMNAATAAHRSLPFGTIVRVTNLGNGRTTKVRINDRGPYANGRIIDLSAHAARDLGMHQSGTARVRIEQFKSDQPGGGRAGS